MDSEFGPIHECYVLNQIETILIVYNVIKNVTVFTVSEGCIDATVYQIMLTTEYKKGRLDERQN